MQVNRLDADQMYLTLVKGRERYVFCYPDTYEARAEVLRAFGRLAADPDLSFTWMDAAVLSQKVRQSQPHGGV